MRRWVPLWLVGLAIALAGASGVTSLAQPIVRDSDRPDCTPETPSRIEPARRVDRGEARYIMGLPERSARRILTELTTVGLLASRTPKGPVSLRFPAASLEALFPRLYSHT